MLTDAALHFNGYVAHGQVRPQVCSTFLPDDQRTCSEVSFINRVDNIKLRLEPVMYNVLVCLMNERIRSGSTRQGDTKFYWFFSIGSSTTCFPHHDRLFLYCLTLVSLLNSNHPLPDSPPFLQFSWFIRSASKRFYSHFQVFFESAANANFSCFILCLETFERTLNYARDCRQLLLATIPILAISLVALVLANMFLSTGLFAAAISFTFVTIFTCSFVTGNSSYSFSWCSK